MARKLTNPTIDDAEDGHYLWTVPAYLLRAEDYILQIIQSDETASIPLNVTSNFVPKLVLQSARALSANSTSGNNATSSTGAQTASDTSTAGQTGQTGQNADDSKGGLSTGAKAAIGVCVPLVVLLLVAGAYFYGRRQRRPQGDQVTAELPAAPERAELYTKANTAEMPGTSAERHELAGAPVGEKS